MTRYLRLWLSFLKMSWMADIEYRLNFTVRILGEVVWYAAQLSVFEVLYTHTSTISGWDVHSMRVFMGTLFFADVVYMILFSENLDMFFSLVRKGDLDLYLLKPVNSQFMVSCRKVSVAYIVNMLMVLVYLIWGILNLNHAVSPLQLLGYATMILLGVVTIYSLRFMFSTLAIIFQDFTSIQFIWHQLYRLGTRPDILYPSFLRLFIMTLFPVAFFASVPARVLIEGFDIYMLLASLVFGLGFLALSNRAWEAALKKYSSASS